MVDPYPTMAGDLDPADPYARAAQTFPCLSEEMAGRVARYGSPEHIEGGTFLFERGQRSVDFFLVVDGAIEMLDMDAHGASTVFTTHRARQFTGEMDLFNERKVLVSSRAAGNTRVVRVKRGDFKRLVAGEPDIGEVIMRALILRRVGLIRHGQGGVVLIGPGHGADTLRLQRFMTRNGYPFQLLDTERNPDAGGFLECFDLASHQLPVLILPGQEVLRNPVRAPRAWPPPSMRHRRGCRPSYWRARRREGRPAHRRRSKTTSAFQPAYPGRRWPGGRKARRRSSARGSPLPAP
jgi:thioredoxin reductase (NADPH)